MRRLSIIGIIIVSLILVSAVACNPFGGDEEDEGTQFAEVERGNIAVTVSGTGNIEISHEANLAFDIGGTIEKINIDDGDVVAAGDVLANLDTTDLELALVQSKVSLSQAQVALTQAEVNLTQAELAVNSANVSLRTARHDLEEARDIYTWPEINVAKEEAKDAEAFLDYVLDRGLDTATIVYAQLRLDAAEAILDTMVRSYDTEEVAIERMEVAVAVETLELKKISVSHAEESVAYAAEAVEYARKSLENAQKQLDDATLIAPFDGVVAKLYTKEGDIIPPPTLTTTTIIHLVDLATMELKVEVDEIDMPDVTLGQRALVDIDALPELALDGEITYISTLAKQESGVVLYDVTISFDVPEGSRLRAGMSADADIVISGKTNVLLVPDRAIKQGSEGGTVVEVMVDEQFEEKPVVTGVSDGVDTEIISGLTEGEMVVSRR